MRSLVIQTLFQARNTGGIKQRQNRSQKIPAGPKLAFHLPTSWTQCLYSLWVPAPRISQLRFIGDNQAKVILAYFPCLELNAVNTRATKKRVKGKKRKKKMTWRKKEFQFAWLHEDLREGLSWGNGGGIRIAWTDHIISSVGWKVRTFHQNIWNNLLNLHLAWG